MVKLQNMKTGQCQPLYCKPLYTSEATALVMGDQFLDPFQITLLCITRGSFINILEQCSTFIAAAAAASRLNVTLSENRLICELCSCSSTRTHAVAAVANCVKKIQVHR
jgi:hypothetical protein